MKILSGKLSRKLSKKKLLAIAFTTTFLGINLFGYAGAYLLTNYKQDGQGIGAPRPVNRQLPKEFQLEYTSQRLPINDRANAYSKDRQWLDTWLIPSVSPSQGTVILFHGKDSKKSTLLASAKTFNQLGYDTLLVDFRGSGGSSGNTTTIGVRESEDVVLAFKHVQRMNHENRDRPIILYGISMGSAAVLRAVAKADIKPEGIILELPFASLLNAVKARFARDRIPTSPLSELLVFWGGVQHGFNGFTHNPVEYAKQVKCPTLILHGSQDPTVNIADVEKLHGNINADKHLVTFADAGHELLVEADPQLWQENVGSFLDKLR